MIRVHMAVNNEYGNLSGHCDKIEVEVGDDSLSLEPTVLAENMSGPRIWIEKERSGEGRLRFLIGEVWCDWFHFGYTSAYIGNICWNVYHMAGADVVRLFKVLKRSGIWEPEEGTTTWWTWWEKLDAQTRSGPWESVITEEIK